MPDPGRDRYRRGQRRRARIAWAVLGLLVVGIGLAIAFGGNDESSDGNSEPGLLPAEMSASAYTSIHKGQTEVEVLGLIGVPGQQESEVETELLQLSCRRRRQGRVVSSGGSARRPTTSCGCASAGLRLRWSRNPSRRRARSRRRRPWPSEGSRLGGRGRGGPFSHELRGGSFRVPLDPAQAGEGTCWVMQWMLPPPRRISLAGTPTTSRSGNVSARMRAASSSRSWSRSG
jgi:hypothetical protein